MVKATDICRLTDKAASRMRKMTIDQKICVTFIQGITACFSFALLVSSDASNRTNSCCKDGFGLNYTLPMFHVCTERNHNGRMVQTIPKLIPASSAYPDCQTRNRISGIPSGQRVCRFPDCDKKVCNNGWCEETIESFECHCLTGYQGKYCNETAESTLTTDKVISVRTELETSPAVTTLAPPLCPEPWIRFENSCYRHFPDKVNFPQALRNCRNIDTGSGHPDLVSIHSQQEMDFLLDVCQSLPTCQGDQWVWIGLYQPDSDVEGPFVWSDGTPVDYSSWAPHKPDDYAGCEDCAIIVISNQIWNDIPCMWKKGYFCKITLTV